MVARLSPKKSPMGVTLVELIVGLGVLSIVLLMVTRLVTDSQQQLADAQKRQQLTAHISIISGHLQKFLASGDIRFFAFSGNGGSDQTLARFMIPQAGLCRDLSSCSDQTSLLYVHYDKTTSPAVSAICLLPPPGGHSASNAQSFLIDLNDESYGPATFDPAKKSFTVTGTSGSLFSTGEIPMAAGTLIALMNPPKATLWVATGKPVSFSASQDATTGEITYPGPAGSPLPDDCVSQLRDDAPATPPSPQMKKLDKLVKVTVRPYVLGQFTGGSLVTNDEMAKSVGSFPMRIFISKIRAVGPKRLTPGDIGYSPTTPGYNFGYSDCVVTPSTQKLDCSAVSQVTAGPISRVRIDEIFALALYYGGAPSTAARFELLGAAMAQSGACVLPDCAPLTMPASSPSGTMKVLVDVNERYDNLNATLFSLLKQESLATVRFRLITQGAQQKEESFNVRIP